MLTLGIRVKVEVRVKVKDDRVRGVKVAVQKKRGLYLLKVCVKLWIRNLNIG